MIRRLRLKFVCILMALLTLMLGVTIFLTLHFTRANLESESIRTLQSIAMDPSGLSQSDESAGRPTCPISFWSSTPVEIWWPRGAAIST